jgi:hypothetical protein
VRRRGPAGRRRGIAVRRRGIAGRRRRIAGRRRRIAVRWRPVGHGREPAPRRRRLVLRPRGAALHPRRPARRRGQPARRRGRPGPCRGRPVARPGEHAPRPRRPAPSGPARARPRDTLDVRLRVRRWPATAPDPCGDREPMRRPRGRGSQSGMEADPRGPVGARPAEARGSPTVRVRPNRPVATRAANAPSRERRAARRSVHGPPREPATHVGSQRPRRRPGTGRTAPGEGRFGSTRR